MNRLPAHLQHLTDGLPPGNKADVEEAIATSPYLQQRMTEAVQAGQLEHIRLTATGAHEGGHYSDRGNTIYLSADTFSDPELKRNRNDRIDVLTSTLGHETGHALNGKETEKTLYFVTGSIDREIRTAGPGGEADLTPYFAMHQRSARNDEASAEIEGWNALASRLEHLNGGAVTREEMLRRSAPTTHCITVDSNRVPHLANGIVLDADMAMSDHRLPKAGPINLEPVAACHFDQSDRSLGAGGAANYANYYGAYLIEQIGQNTEAWANPPTIKLDMAKLGLDKAQLESTGLNLGGQDLHFVDTSHGSYRPVVVRHSGSGVNGAPDIEQGTAQVALTPLMSEPGHSAHTMYMQTMSALRASPNIPAGTFSEHEEQKLAAGIVAQALTQQDAFQKPRVDHAVLSRDGSMVIGVQGALDSPANRLAGVDIQQALSATSIEQSSDVARTALQSMQLKQEQAQEQLAQAASLGPDTPTSSGPVMRMGGRSITSASGDASGQ